MRRAYAVLVAVVVLLAGCPSGSPTTAAPSPDGASTPERTPTATDPSTPSDPLSVPGVTADGVNVTRLLGAHNESLRGGAYTFALATVRGETRRQVVLQRESNGRPTLLSIERGNQSSVEYFADRVYQRFVSNGSVSYNTAIYTRPPSFTGLGILDTEMRQATYTPAGTVSRNGTDLLVLTANKSDLRADAFGQATLERFGSRALVDRNGTIRSFRLVAVGNVSGGPFLWRTEMRVTDVGTTTVVKPDWVSKARNSTSTGDQTGS